MLSFVGIVGLFRFLGDFFVGVMAWHFWIAVSDVESLMEGIEESRSVLTLRVDIVRCVGVMSAGCGCLRAEAA